MIEAIASETSTPSESSSATSSSALRTAPALYLPTGQQQRSALAWTIGSGSGRDSVITGWSPPLGWSWPVDPFQRELVAVGPAMFVILFRPPLEQHGVEHALVPVRPAHLLADTL